MRIRYAAGIYIAVALFILAGNTPSLLDGKWFPGSKSKLAAV